MAQASKADVLKRYLGGGEEEKKKKKKKAKSSSSSGFKVIDSADDDWGRGGGGDDGGYDDAPVVVDASETIAYSLQARGSWSEVAAAASANRADDSDTEPPRRKRHDSDSDGDSAPPRRPVAAAPGAAASATSHARPRPDSDSDPEPPRRSRRHDSDGSDSDSAPPRRPPPAPQVLTSSGHVAGLQSGEQFRQHDARLRQERESALANVDASLAGKDAPTMYRDSKGRKVDMLGEFIKKQAIAEGQAVRLEKAQQELGRGTVQKESAEQARRELEILADEPFARAADDPRMEALRRQEIREGDPMAEYFASKQQQGAAGGGAAAGGDSQLARKSQKPKYKGPAPPRNRFNIAPGYRWDGVDRGNQWETKILKAANSKQALKGDGAAWSMSDM